MSAIILAGGKSSRMGEEDKPFLPFGRGQTLIHSIVERLGGLFSEIIIVTRSPQDYRGLFTSRVVEDIYAAGPLGGLHAGLFYSSSQYSFVLACDMPFIDLRLVEYMLEVAKEDILIPVLNEKLEPLHAVYKKSCLPAIEKKIREKRFRVISFFPEVTVEYLPQSKIQRIDPHGTSFFNINTRNEYLLALNMKAGEGQE